MNPCFFKMDLLTYTPDRIIPSAMITHCFENDKSPIHTIQTEEEVAKATICINLTLFCII